MNKDQLKKGILIKDQIDIVLENLDLLNEIETKLGLKFDKITIGKENREFECIVHSSDFADTIKFLIRKKLNSQLLELEILFNNL